MAQLLVASLNRVEKIPLAIDFEARNPNAFIQEVLCVLTKLDFFADVSGCRLQLLRQVGTLQRSGVFDMRAGSIAGHEPLVCDLPTLAAGLHMLQRSVFGLTFMRPQ